MLTIERGTELTSTNGELSSAVAEPGAPVHTSLRRQVADAWSCSPDLASDLPKLRILLRIALSVMLLYLSACLFNAHWYEAGDLAPLPLRIFNVAFTVAAIAGVEFLTIHRWRWWAMAYCLILTGSFLLHGLIVGDEEPLFAGMFCLSLDVAVILPWGGRWQAWFAVAGVVATLIAVACGLVTWEFAPHWTVLIASMIFSVTLAFVKDYSYKQRLLIEELQLRELSFRAEC